MPPTRLNTFQIFQPSFLFQHLRLYEFKQIAHKPPCLYAFNQMSTMVHHRISNQPAYRNFYKMYETLGSCEYMRKPQRHN